MSASSTKASTTVGSSSVDEVPTALSTTALENKLRRLREESQKDSQLLTQKLASSQSGQNLLHIGTSLSTLPPDLHSLLTHLHPILSSAEQSEKEQLKKLQELVEASQEIRVCERRVQHAAECADLYADLVAAESSLQGGKTTNLKDDDESDSQDEMENGQQQADVEIGAAELDSAASLERAAHITLCLVQDLRSATDAVSSLTMGKRPSDAGTTLPTMHTPLEHDSEQAQFLMKLAPRIRRLEADTARALGTKMESVLKLLQDARQPAAVDNEEEEEEPSVSQKDLLLMLGHCMRGLALLGRGKEVEGIFAQVAIMPLIRSKVSMGRLDEGGARGECAGLSSLLDEMAQSISQSFGPALRLAESMFDVGDEIDVDLLTAGVWVPVATALMADAGIKMAIFSPGIASILQSNYVALDSFLSELAARLLQGDGQDADGASPSEEEDLMFQPDISPKRIQHAQDRIYAHSKTAEFSKKWNLPIYYQLRFGDCCSRLNKAVEQTRIEGWIADVFHGQPAEAEKLKESAGFELSLFLELYDILLGLWRPDVILSPLANRFLRGAVQLVGRVIAFVNEGMDGAVKFGAEPQEVNGVVENGNDSAAAPPPAYPTRSPYCWGESEQDVAAVAWELTILDSTLRHDYVDLICDALGSGVNSHGDETRSVIADVLADAAEQIHPIIDKAWNEHVVKILTEKCSTPLAAVKGIAGIYRMTNRPPPTQASPFVAAILRPLTEFISEFQDRTPDRVGSRWKQMIIVTIADKYADAVKDLLDTVQRTEVALNSRRARRATAGGMRDGEKVKLQLYLDYKLFSQSVESVGVVPATVIGLSRLEELTAEGQTFLSNKNAAGS